MCFNSQGDPQEVLEGAAGTAHLSVSLQYLGTVISLQIIADYGKHCSKELLAL